MASMTFLINDSSTGGNVPVVKLVITENADGSVTFNVTQQNGYVGDLRGLFFDIADESLIGTLSTVAAAGLTELQQGNDSIKDLGNGANMQGLLGDGGGYDVGVEFGSAGIGQGDDYRSFTFTLRTSNAGGLDLSDFSKVSFGARITSVGLDSNGDGVFESARNGSAKIGETTFSVVSPGNNAVMLAEDEVATAASTNGNLLANDGAGAGDTLSISGWSDGTSSFATGTTFTSAALSGAAVTINADGTWTVDANAADALAAGDTVSQTFTYTVLQSNVDGSSTQQASFTVTITGSNDAAIITGQSSAALTETDAAQSIGGDLNATDVDGPATFIAHTGVAGNNGHGSFSIDAAGTWVYTMNNAHDEFVAGQTYTDSVIVDTADGTTRVISVTITGSNDAAMLSADVSDLTESNAPLTTSGTLTISDVDSAETFVTQTGTVGTYGTFAIDAAGAWTYSASSAHDEFVAGTTYTDTFDVASADGTHTSVTITILGTNDAAIVSDAVVPLQETDAPLAASGTLTSDDVDNPDNTFSASAATGAIGNFAIDAGGAWTFTANSAFDHLAVGQSVSETFNVVSIDGTPSTVAITITGTNDAPVAVADTNRGAEDTIITGTVATNDSDADNGAVLTFAQVGAMAGLTINGDGSYSFDASNAAYQHLAQGVTADVVAGYTVTDQHGAASANTLTITLTGTNDTPVAVADTNSGVEDTTITGTVATNDGDADDGAVLTFAQIGAVAGLTISADGSYSFDAGNAAYQHLAQGVTTDVVASYIVTDQHGASSASTLTITLTGTNDTPVAVADSNAGNEDATITGTVATNDNDADDSAVLTYSQIGAVAGLTINADGSYSFDAGNAAYQHLAQGATTDVVAGYTVTDQHGASSASTLTITLTGTNDTPVAVADTNSSVEDSTITGTVATNDSDVDDSAVLTYAQVGAVAGLTINPDGTYSFDASNAAYQHLAQGATTDVVATYSVTDQHGAASTSTLTITLTGTNDTPVAVADANSGLEDTTITGTVATNDSDVDDGAVLSYATTGPVPAGLTFNSNGSYSFDASNAVYQHLAQGATEVVTVGYTATDEHGAFSTSTLTITLTGTNDAPIAVADSNAGNEDTTITGTVASNDSDVDDGAVVTYAATGPVTAGLTFNSNGSYGFDASNAAYQHLAQSATEVVSVGYTVTDEHGAFATSTLTITLTGTNDTPVAVADSNAGNEDTTITGTVATNDSDVDDGAVLTYTTTSPAPAGLTFNSNGSYSFDAGNAAYQHLAQGATEIVTVGYTVTDEHGAAAASTLTITLTGTNDTPVAVADTNAADAVIESGVNPGNTSFAGDRSASGNALTNDTDIDDGSGKSVVNTGTQAGAYGSLLLNADGSWTYTLDNADADTNALMQGQAATEIFSYTMQDQFGATSSSTLTISITGTNDAPVAVGDSVNGNEDSALTTGNVLANDSDVDQTLVAANITTFTQAANGSVVNNGNGTFTYNPNANFNGSDSFTYTITDAFGATSSATVNVTVAAVNDAPLATITPVSYSATEQISLGLKNNGLAVSDIDAAGGAVTVTLSLGEGTLNVSAGTSGAAVANSGTGSVTISGTVAQINALLNSDATSSVAYIDNTDTPSASTTLTMTVNDNGNTGGGGPLSSTDTATIAISAVNDAPVNNGLAAFSTNEDTAKAITGLSISDADAGAGTLTTTLSVAHGTLVVSGGSATISGSGTASVTLTGSVAAINATLAATVTYTPQLNYAGSDSLTMSTNDGGNSGSGGTQTDTDTVTATVISVNDNPVVAADRLIVSTNTAVSISAAVLLGNDTDIDGAALTITGVGGATGITGLTLNANGTISFTSGGTAGATAGSFTYTVSDGNGGTATATVTVDVRTIGNGNSADMINLSTAGAYQASYIDAGGGADNLTGGAAGDTFIGGAGNGSDNLIGSAGNDLLVGGDGNDTLTGGLGNDTLRGGLGNGDVMDGGAGSEDMLDFSDGTAALNLTLVQSAVATTLANGTGGLGNNDTYANMEGVIGTVLNDTITGSSGNDILRGGVGNDALNGGAGTADLIDFSDGTAGLNFTLTQSAGGTPFNAGAAGLGTDTYSNMEGVIGTNFADMLTGSSSADVLHGGGGNDTISGGAGADRIAGGSGADALSGGIGADTFVFDAAPNAVDTLSDFEAAGTDLVELSLSTFTALTTASGATLGAGEFAFSNGGGAGDSVGAGVHVIYDSATGNLYYDSDGGSAASRTLLATLTLTNPADTFDNNDIRVGS